MAEALGVFQQKFPTNHNTFKVFKELDLDNDGIN
jgi:hypothetical protein